MFFYLHRIFATLQFLVICIISINLLLYSFPSFARVKLVPSVSTAVNYTDNIRLSVPGTEETERVFQVTPALLISADTQYVDAFLDYQVQFLKYKNNDNSDTRLNKVNGYFDAEITPQTFFLNMSIEQSTQAINSDDPIPTNDFTLSNNRADVLSFTIRPYIKQQYGTFASLLARYAYERSRYANLDSSPENADFTNVNGSNHRVLIELKSGPQFVRGSWSVEYNRNDFENTLIGASKKYDSYQQLLFKGSYRLKARLSANAAAGYENNNLISGAESGFTGNIGAGWNPSRRFFVSGSVGRRFYGNTKAFLLNYRARRADLSAGYNEEITNNTGVNTANGIDNNINDPQNPASAPTGVVPTQNNTFFPTLSNEIFVRKVFSGDLNVKSRKGSIKWYVFNERREFDSLGRNDENVLGSSVTLQLLFGQTFYATLLAEWSRTDYNDGSLISNGNQIVEVPDRVDDIKRGELSFNKTVSKQIIFKLAYSYNERVSNFASKDFNQNVVTANVDVILDRLK